MHNGDTILVGCMKSQGFYTVLEDFVRLGYLHAMKNYQLVCQPYLRVVNVIS